MFLPATATAPTAATRAPAASPAAHVGARLDERLVTIGRPGSSAQGERRPSATGTVDRATLPFPFGAAVSREADRVPLAHRSPGHAPQCIDESSTDPTPATACTAGTPRASRRGGAWGGALFVTVNRAPGAVSRPGGR